MPDVEDELCIVHSRIVLKDLTSKRLVSLNERSDCLAEVLRNVFGFIFPSLEGLLLVLLPHHRTIVILALSLIVDMLSVGLLVVRLRRHHRLGWRLQLF